MKTTIPVFFIGFLTWINYFGYLEACNYSSRGNLVFPGNFSFGVSTSAYQIEGGWNEDGKGSSNWDDFTLNHPELIMDRTDGNKAADSYHRFDDDLDLLNDLRVNHYRFSISWSRIFPNGEVKHRNQAGVDYYNKIIDKLLASGITPLVTLNHFDIPLELQKKGGYISSLIIEYFVQYAIEIFSLFGDRVKNWITFNEPLLLCRHAYGEALYPPLINASGLADYLCIHNILKAHGATYQVYKSRFFPKQKGKVGISLNSAYFVISNASDEDLLERALQFNLGFLAHPIFSKTGGYPEVMVKDIARNSLEEGRFTSRLPSLEGYWRGIIKGSADFLGLNYYASTQLKRASKPFDRSPSFERDTNYEAYRKTPSVGQTQLCDPAGLEGLLLWIRKEYNNVPVIITENGYRDDGEEIDENRTNYLKAHLQAVLNALNDGCNVQGYTHWSLVDNFEWIFGYTAKYGLYKVDFDSPERKRHPKKSARFYKKVINMRRLEIDNVS